MNDKKKSPGRPKSARPLVPLHIYIYKDHLPLSSDEIRKAVDFYRFISPEKRAKIMEQ